MHSDLGDKLKGMEKIGYKVMNVSDLVQRLAGLPPMMEVYIDAGGVPMFLNHTEVQNAEDRAPFFRLICNEHPVVYEPLIKDLTYEQQLDRQRQRAMNMSAQIDRETKMHPMVD